MKEGYIFSVQKLAQKKDEDIQRKKNKIHHLPRYNQVTKC